VVFAELQKKLIIFALKFFKNKKIKSRVKKVNFQGVHSKNDFFWTKIVLGLLHIIFRV